MEVTRSRLATTQTALEIMGKAQELLASISKSEQALRDEQPPGQR